MTLGIIELAILSASFLVLMPLFFRVVRALTFKALSHVLPYDIDVVYTDDDGIEHKDTVKSVVLARYIKRHSKGKVFVHQVGIGERREH